MLLLLSHNDDDDEEEGDNVDDRFTLEVEVGWMVENEADIDGNTVLLLGDVEVVVVVVEEECKGRLWRPLAICVQSKYSSPSPSADVTGV